MFTILLVEDQAICREPLAKLLRYEGYRVLTAANGIQAITALQTAPVDLLLLDLILPKMNGLALLQQIRENEKWRSIPVIAVTGSMDSSQIARLIELRVSEIFSKMRFSIEELLASIVKHLPEAQPTSSA